MRQHSGGQRGVRRTRRRAQAARKAPTARTMWLPTTTPLGSKLVDLDVTGESCRQLAATRGWCSGHWRSALGKWRAEGSSRTLRSRQVALRVASLRGGGRVEGRAGSGGLWRGWAGRSVSCRFPVSDRRNEFSVQHATLNYCLWCRPLGGFQRFRLPAKNITSWKPSTFFGLICIILLFFAGNPAWLPPNPFTLMQIRRGGAHKRN